jgi:hypothetical protein
VLAIVVINIFMNQYYIDLKFDIPLFQDESLVNEILDIEGKSKPVDQSYLNRGTIKTTQFNPALVEWLDKKGLSPLCSDFFYRVPHNVGPIHTDGKPGDVGKLNWIFGQDDQSIMYWYKPKADAVGEYGVGPFGTGYTLFNEDDLVLVESAAIKGSPTLVNIGVPHRIINGALNRLCITMHLTDHVTGKQPTWARCVEIFRSEMLDPDQ